MSLLPTRCKGNSGAIPLCKLKKSPYTGLYELVCEQVRMNACVCNSCLKRVHLSLISEKKIRSLTLTHEKSQLDCEGSFLINFVSNWEFFGIIHETVGPTCDKKHRWRHTYCLDVLVHGHGQAALRRVEGGGDVRANRAHRRSRQQEQDPIRNLRSCGRDLGKILPTKIQESTGFLSFDQRTKTREALWYDPKKSKL